MAHNYSIDLAFDLDSDPKGNYEGFLDLACTEDGSVHSLDKVKKGRSLYFTIYDSSEGTSQGKGTPKELRVNFAPADTSTTASSPLGASTTSLTLSTFYSRGEKTSPAFGKGASYYAQDDDRSSTDPAKYEITDTGRFFVTVALDVEYPDTSTSQPVTKTFGQDPRMNVDT